MPWSSRRAAPRRLRVEIVAGPGRAPLPAARCRRLLEAAAGSVRRQRGATGPRCAARRLPPPALTVLFASDAVMRDLNRRFRSIDRSTDVLSFPVAARGAPVATPEGLHLGDLAIGVQAARRQARARGHALAREVEILLLHGFLHLLGYDHETDAGQMLRLEARLQRQLGIRSPGRSPA